MAENASAAAKGRRAPAAPIITDSRFAKLHTDPRFGRTPKGEAKVKVDKRFQSMFKDPAFKATTSKVDKYGRKVTNAEAPIMNHYVRPEVEEEVESEEDEEEKPAYDPARGIGVIGSSSGEESSDEAMEEVATVEEEEAAPKEVIPLGDASSRFAVLNMDWDHIKAVDILAVLQSFTPGSGVIKSITVHPSDFGMTRMALEDKQGPIGIWADAGEEKAEQPQASKRRRKKPRGKPDQPKNRKKQQRDEDEEEGADERSGEEEASDKEDELPALGSDPEEEGPGVDNEKLRAYQLDRLKYYFAVVECDSVNTAYAIYREVDGMEFEQSANLFDLRFIPDGTTFTGRPVRERAVMVPPDYKPPVFQTKAKQHTNVELEWDKTDSSRTLMTQRKFTENDLKDVDFKAYLASEDEDSDAENIRSRYAGLLAEIEEEGEGEKQEDVVVTFESGLRADVEKLVAKKADAKNKEDTSVWDKYLERRKQKKKEFKRQQKLRAEGGGEGEDDEGGDAAADPDSMLVDDVLPGEEEVAEARPGKDKKKQGKKLSSKLQLDTDEKAKQELELLMLGEGEDASRNFNFKEIVKDFGKDGKKKKKKGKKGDEAAKADEFKVDVQDPRFASMYGDSQFAIDPTNPNFKRTPAMEALIKERQARTQDAEHGGKKRKERSNKPDGGAEDGPPRKKAKNTVAPVASTPSEPTADLSKLVAKFKKAPLK